MVVPVSARLVPVGLDHYRPECVMTLGLAATVSGHRTDRTPRLRWYGRTVHLSSGRDLSFEFGQQVRVCKLKLAVGQRTRRR